MGAVIFSPTSPTDQDQMKQFFPVTSDRIFRNICYNGAEIFTKRSLLAVCIF